MLAALTMSNGGKYYNEDYGGEVYYDTPSMLGALTFWSDLVHKHKVIRRASTKGPGVSTGFFSGQTSMMLLSTGSLTYHPREHQDPLQGRVRADERAQRRAIGGASLVMPRASTRRNARPPGR